MWTIGRPGRAAGGRGQGGPPHPRGAHKTQKTRACARETGALQGVGRAPQPRRRDADPRRVNWSQSTAGVAGASGSVLGGAIAVIVLAASLSGAPGWQADDRAQPTERPLVIPEAPRPR